MKKHIFIIPLLVLLLGQMAYAQLTMKDLVKGEPDVVFLGLDFTQARFVGSYGFDNPYTIENHYLEEWNKLMLREFQKYNMHEALRVNYYHYSANFDHHIELNKRVNIKEVITNQPYRMDLKLVKKTVETYQLENMKGIGVSFIVESFDKNLGLGSIWVTFIDLSTGDFIYSELIRGEANGVGFRNYWARSVYEVINKVKRDKYTKWKRKFRKG